MKRKTIILLTSCLVFATALVLVLYAASDKIVRKPGSFLRIYQKQAVTKSGELDIEYNSYYIAGIADNHVYLGNITAPLSMLVLNLALTDTQHVKISVKGIKDSLVYLSASIKIHPPHFYLNDGIKPAIYSGTIGKWEVERVVQDDTRFSEIIPIGNTSFAIRSNETVTQNHILGKISDAAPKVKFNSSLLQKQVDGIFCTDGMLQYNPYLSRLIYTYYYRNEYIVCDTNLNLDYRGHTIDTFSRAQIKIGHISSSKTNKLLSKKTINLRTATCGNYLFIKSNLLAKNDTEDMLRYQAIIDVYDLTGNVYKFSFTVPDYDAQSKLRDFMVFENRILIAIYNHFIVRYDMRPDYFNEPITVSNNFSMTFKDITDR